MKAWMRDLTVSITSRKYRKRMTFGDRPDKNVNIEIEGTKYLSTMKDNFVVKISNLTYFEVVQMIQGQFFDVEISCGYKSATSSVIFNGQIVSISNQLDSPTTNTVIIICASRLVGLFNQRRLNLTFQSGINLYAALKHICRRAGIPESNVSEEFRHRFFSEVQTINSTAGNYLDSLSDTFGNILAHADASGGAVTSIWDSLRTDARIIQIRRDNIILTRGFPTLSSQGLTLTLLPSFNFIPGDTIVIDNSLIDISISDLGQIGENPGHFLDRNGQYVIHEIAYSLGNRQSDFSLRILAKSRTLMRNIVGF